MNWDEIEKPNDEVNLKAKDGDLQYIFGGFAWLLEMPSCNVVCFRYKKTKTTFKQSLLHFLRFLKKNEIQYIRVEGCPGRYRFLTNPNFFPILKKRGLNVIFHRKESEKIKRDVYYVKVY